MAKWETDGRISRNLMVDKLPASVEGVLVSTGEYGVREMRAREKEQVSSGASGRLHDSIMFTTQNRKSGMGGQAEPPDEVEKPSTKDTVAIGSQVPWAYYVEVGSTKHMSSDGHEAFVQSLKDWYRRKFGKDPDAHENFASFNALRDKIMAEGTKEMPFVFPCIDDITEYAKKMLANAVSMNNYATRGKR